MEGMDVKAPRPRCGGSDGAAASAPSLSARRDEVEEEKAAAVEAVSGEDEQVERFYALLANIRAMRGMYSQYRDDAAAAGGDGDGVDGCRGGASRMKRARPAESPWRPAFRMEDFEFEEAIAGDGDDAACSSRKKQRGGHGAGVEKRRTEKEAAADDDDDEEGEVVEGKEPRAAASQPAGPLTS